MATEVEEPLPETRQRQVSRYDELNGLTFGALKRLASDNGIRLVKFPKKHDIIKQIIIHAEGNEGLAAALTAAIPAAPHVSPPSPVRQTSTKQPARLRQTPPRAVESRNKHVGFASPSAAIGRNGRTMAAPSRSNARTRAGTAAIMTDTNRRSKQSMDEAEEKAGAHRPLSNKPPLRSAVTVGDITAAHHRPRASSLPMKATLDKDELFRMNFTQLKGHALTLGLELPRVPTKGKILRMILAYQPDDLEYDSDSGSEEHVEGDEKEEQEEAPDDAPPTEVPAAAPAAAAAAEAVAHEENKPSDVMAMWRQKSNTDVHSRSPAPATEPVKKSNVMSMWQQRAESGKTTPEPHTTTVPRRGGGKVSKFANMFANQNLPVGGGRPPRSNKSPSPTPSISPAPAVSPIRSPATESKSADPPTVAVTEAATESATEEKKSSDGPPPKTRAELNGMGFKTLKEYITNDLGLPLPRVPNKPNCIKAILKHQGGDEESSRTPRPIKLKPKPKPKDVASEIGGTTLADRMKMIAAAQANRGVPPPSSATTSASAPTSSLSSPASPGPRRIGKISDRFPQNNAANNTAPVDARPKPKKRKIGKIGGGMGMAINLSALRPGFRPKARARSSSMITTKVEFQNLELLRPTIQSGKRKSRVRGPARNDAATRILEVEEDDD